MRTMIIDTSTQLLIVSFVVDDKIIYEAKQMGSNNHSDHLLEYIKEGLKKANLEVKDFDRIIIGIGPGAYTGLRVSLTVAKMFSWTLNIPLYTISSLDLLTSEALSIDGIYAVMMKAKKGYIYGKVISVKNQELTIIEPETFMEKPTFEALISKYDYKLIDEEHIAYSALNVKDNLLTKVEDVTFLEPNYLRGEM